VDPQLLSTSKCVEMRSPNPKMADDEGHSSVGTPALGNRIDGVEVTPFGPQSAILMALRPHRLHLP
jgi:hypothetical protein